MVKMNFINVIVSIILMLAGAGFCLYVILTKNWNSNQIIFLIIGIMLIAYGVIRLYLTNRAAKEIE